MTILLMFKSTNWRLLKQKMSGIAHLRQEQKRNKRKRKNADENKVDVAQSIQLARSTDWLRIQYSMTTFASGPHSATILLI